MIVAGCDVGTLTTKAVIMKDGSMVSYEIVATEAKPEKAAKVVMENTLSKVGLSFKDLDFCVATGWGRKKAGFAGKDMGEIPCIGKGAYKLNPSLCTVINIGAQASSVIRIGKNGNVLDYGTNDKCASGTGKFLGVISEALELNVSEMGALSLQSKNPVSISNQCAVFAESEVISYVNEGMELADIACGINNSIARRLVTLAKRVGVKEDVCIVGGVAKNIGVVKDLERMLDIEMKKLPVDPQIVGALGAAVIAEQKAK